MSEKKALSLSDPALAEEAHAKFAEIEKSESAQKTEEPKAEEPKTEEPEKKSGAEPQKPESDSTAEGSGTQDAGPSKESAPATTAETKAAEKRVFKALLGGQIKEVNEDDLIKLAQAGYSAQEIMQSVHAERQRIAEQGKKLSTLMEQIKPYKERLDKLKEEEEEDEKLDPSIALRREQADLKKRLETFEQAQQLTAQRAAQEAAQRDFLARVAGAQAKHEAFKVIATDPDLKERVDVQIMRHVASGVSIEEAVAREAGFYSKLLDRQKAEVKTDAVKKAAERAKLPNIPGKGAAPATPERKFTRESLYNGEAFDLAMQKFASAAKD